MLGRMKTHTHITPSIGPTEREILDILWDRGPLTIRQVHTIVTERRAVAYTTIMTTTVRLEEKGIIARISDGCHQRSTYTLIPIVSRSELIAQVVTHFCADIGASDGDRHAALAVLGQ